MEELFFIIEDDPEGGYTAAALGHSIYTAGETIDEVKRNIRDAVSCHFGETGGPRLVRLRFVHEESFTCA
jgi:predicted RNase H-like HicB family nuclease